MKTVSPAELASASKDKGPEQYEIEDAARTLTKAQEIKANKKLMPHVHKHLKKQHKAMANSIADLKRMRDEMNDPEDRKDHGADEATEKE